MERKSFNNAEDYTESKLKDVGKDHQEAGEGQLSFLVLVLVKLVEDKVCIQEWDDRDDPEDTIKLEQS